MKTASPTYLDYPPFKKALTDQDQALLRNRHVLFSFPMLEENDLELSDPPVSQSMLSTLCRDLGCRTTETVAILNGDAIEFDPKLGEDAPDFIVIHPMINIWDHTEHMIGALKERFPDARVVLQNSDQHQHEKLIGGPAAAEIAVHVLERLPQADLAICGYAEHSLASILLDRPSELVLSRSGPGNHSAHFFAIDSLPDPTSHMGPTGKRTVRVQRSRGCLAGCTYCIEGQANRSSEGERPWDGVDMEKFVDRLEILSAKDSFFVNIVDSSFEDPGRKGIAQLRLFCTMIRKRGLELSFKIHLRAETVHKFSDDDLALMKSAGIDVIVIGIESGNQDELSIYRKISDSDTSARAIDRLLDSGLFCVIGGYMMFTPFATADILKEKTAYLRRIRCGWDFLNLTNRLLVFWGTKLHRYLAERDMLENSARPGEYLEYRHADQTAERLHNYFNAFKRQRPGFMNLNNALYDASNLESRMLNPVNRPSLDAAGDAFERFRASLAERKSRLNDLYCLALQNMIDDPAATFLPDFDAQSELTRQRAEIEELLLSFGGIDPAANTLHFSTWMSVVNRFGANENRNAAV